MRELKDNPGPGRAAVLAAADPANPFGVTLPWPAWCEGAGERRAHHHVVIADGELTALLFADGARVLPRPPKGETDDAVLERLSALAIAWWMRRRAIRIVGHENSASPLNAGPLSRALRDAGLTPSGPGFRL
jgi:ATP-dependent Lhr-like helicase